MNRSLHLYLVVFIAGASVLAIEILGTRVLGPFYGVSLFLWSALITVTLAALSVGYVIGGRWADRGPAFSRLAIMLALAGVWLLLTPWIKGPMLDLLGGAPLRVAVLVAATALFFIPLVLLGMVGPYAIRLRAGALDEVGRTAGNIYAVSTVASVVAALLTGFVLIPSMGVGRIILSVAVALLVGSLIALLGGRSGRTGVAGVVALILGGGAVAGLTPVDRPDPDRGLVAIRQSPYAEIRVVDWEGDRILLIDGGGHTVIDRESGRNLYPYVNVMEINKFFFEKPGKLLLMGLGGGSLVKLFDEGSWDVDVVEIDPVIAEVAREYFGLEERMADVTIMDGRQYLISHDTVYDLILLDAFGSSSIPFHLVTEEAFGLVKRRMAPDGVLAINVQANGWNDTIIRALGATLRRHFSTVLALPLVEPRNAFGNLVVLAANRPLEFPEEMLGRPADFMYEHYQHSVVLDRNHAWDNRFEPSMENAQVLTDDRNPVDVWAEALNLESRRMLHSDYRWKHLAY